MILPMEANYETFSTVLTVSLVTFKFSGSHSLSISDVLVQIADLHVP